MAVTVATADICVPQHDAQDLYFDIVDDGGVAVDVSTASEIVWIIADAIDGTIRITKALTGTGLTLQTNSRVKVELTSANMNMAAADYYHELRITNVAGDPATVLKGTFTIEDTRIGDA